METMNRRKLLMTVLCGTAAATATVALMPSALEATPLAIKKELVQEPDNEKELAKELNIEMDLAREPDKVIQEAQWRGGRRRRRWVCWWRRGRRVCGWRWV